VSDETQSLSHFNAREEAMAFIELEAGWALDWIFWRRVSSLVPTKI